MQRVFGRPWWTKKRSWLLDKELERRKRRGQVVDEDEYLRQQKGGRDKEDRRRRQDDQRVGPERARHLRMVAANEQFDERQENERRERVKQAKAQAKKTAAAEVRDAERRAEMRRKRAQITIDGFAGECVSLVYQPTPVTRKAVFGRR